MVLEVRAQFSNQIIGELTCIEILDTNFVQVVEAVAIVKQEAALSRAVCLIRSVTHVLTAISLVCCHEIGDPIDVVGIEAVRHVRAVDRPTVEIDSIVFITGVHFITGYSVVLEANAKHCIDFSISEINNRHRVVFLERGKSRATVSRESNELRLNVLRNALCFCGDSNRTGQ